MRALDLVHWWPVDSAAAGVLRRTDPTPDGSPGGATVVDGVGDVERPFSWASVTKLLVAMAVLVATEEGTISLDEPAGPPGSTVRHLLAHASGLGPDSPVPVVGPARMRIYSNVGYEILADLLAHRAHMPFSDYLAAGVVDPLHMSGTSLIPGASAASGAHGPLQDLLTLASEFLAPSIVSSATLAAATSVAFPELRGVLPGYGRFDPCDWGLGFEVKGAKYPHWTGTLTAPETFGHFGRAGGFLWVDPVAGVACASLSNRDFGPWAMAEWPTLADAVVEEWTTVPGKVERLPDRSRRKAMTARSAGVAQAERAERAEIPEVPEVPELEQHDPPDDIDGARTEAAAEAARTEAAAEAERRRQEIEAAEVEVAAEVERRRREAEAAEVERRKLEALEAERSNREMAARAQAEEAERRRRAAAEGERHGRTDVSDADGHVDEAAGERRVPAKAERRDEATVRIPERLGAEAGPENAGPLGPGIGPNDFWGRGTR